MGCIIPLYVSPTSSLWNTIIAQKDAHPNVPIAVVVDVSSGPGTAQVPALLTTLQTLRSHGILTLGYVQTDFAQRSLGLVEADVDNWFSFYNAGTVIASRNLNGIFIGSMSNNVSNQTYYHDLQLYCKTTKGFNTTCGEAANRVPTSFLASNCADTVIVYEGAGLPRPSDFSIYENSNRNNIAFLAFGVASINTESLNQLSSLSTWIYHTNDQGMAIWDTLPPYFADLITRLDTLGEGSSVGASFDSFGIRKVYHTKAGGQEWYVKMDDPTSEERFQNAPALTRNTDGSWSCEGGSGNQVRLEAWSPALSNQTDRQNARWLNVEITGYAKAEQEFALGGDFLFQWYGRGGHHSDTRHCEGSTLKYALWRRRENTSDPGLSIGARKEVCHAAYCSARAVRNDAIPWTSTDFYNKWVGMKAVIYNYASGSNTYTRQEGYLDVDVQDGNGNLNAQNDWVLQTINNDTGGWLANESAFNADCDGCGYSRDQIITARGGDTRSSSANYNRNLCAWRTDDIRWRWKYLTVREIDPTKPATGGDPTPPPNNDPAAAFDSLGVRKVYQTKSGGNEWYLASIPANDARFVATHSLTKESDFFRVQAGSPYLITFQIKQPNGYDASRTEAAAANHAQCASSGYMQDSQDWRNVEMQCYFKILSTAPSTAGEIILFARGGEHRDPQPYCAGSSMKGHLLTTGESRFAKEQYHIHYNYTALQNQIGQSLVGTWIGFKYVVYNRKVGNTSTVKQEIYVDTTQSNTWTKIDEKSDVGGWGTGGLQCKGNTEDFLISWGGPIATFRFDNIADMDIKQLSIREINGDAIAVEAPPDQNPGSCGST